jgi:eukaryotic-like serine/threonine-protein kinase
MDQDLADQIKLNQPYTDRYIGQTVADKYEIGDRIGVGGMGVVYKARHVQLNRVFAIKIMAAGNFGFDTKALARFQQEARTVSGLHHHNLVGVHDFGTMSDGAPYLVMDYVEGQSLSAIIKEKR